MPHLYDFGIAQEDPLTEFHILDIHEGDHVLCVASGGEIPLTLLCLQPDIKITAVDVSRSQLALCRLKLQAAIALPHPLNGRFLGFAACDPKERRKLYFDKIHHQLASDDQDFWLENLKAIESGVIHSGRFEGYIKIVRRLLTMIIGKATIRQLIDCENPEQQQALFDRQIGGRKALTYLFHIAFHPAFYKKRGIQSKGLQHAGSNTGDIFLEKFRNFCIATPACRNYFLQYFLHGSCASGEAMPEYCHEHFRGILKARQSNIAFIHSSLEDTLSVPPKETFNKIHLSNVGDWMDREEFNVLAGILDKKCAPGTIACYRYLQKNHLTENDLISNRFDVATVPVQFSDRFPFYSVLSMHAHE